MNDQKEIQRNQSDLQSQKKNKIPRNKLPKKIKYLYSENYKTPVKETECDINRWKYVTRSWIGRINIVKRTILPRAIYSLYP